MAKAPVPGRVKTRLCPPCTPEEAAAVAAAALADTLDAVAGCAADRKIVALDGEPGEWMPPGLELIRQRGDGLAERLANAWSDTGGAGIQIGMDTPQVGAAELDRALALLDHGPRPAVLGPATDGGWWLIGWRQADPAAVFRHVPMSTGHTGLAQERRLHALGFDVVRAPEYSDIDTISDLWAVAADAPASRTAAIAASLSRRMDRVVAVA